MRSAEGSRQVSGMSAPVAFLERDYDARDAKTFAVPHYGGSHGGFAAILRMTRCLACQEDERHHFHTALSPRLHLDYKPHELTEVPARCPA